MKQASFLNTPVSIDRTIFRVLVSIKGIGKSKAREVCRAVGVLPKSPFEKLTESQCKRIENYIQNQENFLFESSLKRNIFINVRKLVKIKHYRGLRLQRGLPVHGQRTKTNAQTSRRIRILVGLFWVVD